MGEIDLKTFLWNMFGWHDSESGYGASYPRSRDISSFFQGRIGQVPDGNAIQFSNITKKEVVRENLIKQFSLLRDDFAQIVKQMDEVIENTKEQTNDQ